MAARSPWAQQDARGSPPSPASRASGEGLFLFLPGLWRPGLANLFSVTGRSRSAVTHLLTRPLPIRSPFSSFSYWPVQVVLELKTPTVSPATYVVETSSTLPFAIQCDFTALFIHRSFCSQTYKSPFWFSRSTNVMLQVLPRRSSADSSAHIFL